MYKYLFAILVIATACNTEMLEDPTATPQPDTYTLVFNSNSALEWNVNGVSGQTDSLDVSHLKTASVHISLSEEDNVSCILYQNDQPTYYYVVTCYPEQRYSFDIDIQ